MQRKIVESRIAKRKEKWVEFLQPDANPGFLFMVDYMDEEEKIFSAPTLAQQKAGTHRIRLEKYQNMMQRAAWLDDDAIPFLGTGTGTEIFAEALGCSVVRDKDNMPFALPCISSAAEVAKIKVPELSTSSLAYLFDLADELQNRGGTEAVMKLVDIQSPMDIASLVWEKVDLMMAMIDCPEAVLELSAKCAELLTNFLDEWFSRYGTDYVAHYPCYFMRGGLTLSEDEIGTVSEAMFQQFFRDELISLSQHFGGIGIHCCADSRHQWQNFKDLPGLRILNFCRPPIRSADFVTDAYEFFADGPAQMHFGWMPNVKTEEIPTGFPENARVVFLVKAKSREQAIEISDTLNQVRG